MVSLLLEGIHTNHHFEDYYDIDPLTSSVTFFQHSGTNMLFDTGTPKFLPEILARLKQFRLAPDDIHYVFNTHFHLDHCGNDAVFKNATVWIGRSSLDYKTGRARIFHNLDALTYPAGVALLQTPGHTVDHVAYLFEKDGVKYVCAGDAVREDTIRSRKIPHCQLPEEFVPSMKKIFDNADVIIPGHGRKIEGELKTELRKIIDAFPT